VDLGDFTVEVDREVEKGARELWKWLALAALGFVIFEWIVYHRRYV
jgi:hypothetical protein